MFSLPASLLLSQFLVIPSTVALILPPSQALDIPASSPAPIPPTLPTAFRPSAVFKTNTTSPPSENVVFHCDAQYGHNLGFASCQDALNQIHWRRDSRTLGFGLRGTGQDYDVLLPYRAISLDGLCALDVVLAPQSTVPEDHATGTFIGSDIALLLAKCVVMTPSKLGGIATGRGTLGNLALIIRSHNPAVTCKIPPPGTVPIRDACHNMMGRIPSSPNAFLVFGNRGQPGVDVGLPLVFFDNLRQCYASIITTAGADTSTWGEVWNTVVDIVGMCIRLGMHGEAKFGLYSLLSMTMSGPSPVKGYVSPGNGDVNPVIGNITTA